MINWKVIVIQATIFFFLAGMGIYLIIENQKLRKLVDTHKETSKTLHREVHDLLDYNVFLKDYILRRICKGQVPYGQEPTEEDAGRVFSGGDQLPPGVSELLGSAGEDTGPQPGHGDPAEVPQGDDRAVPGQRPASRDEGTGE